MWSAALDLQLSCPSTIFHNITSISYNHRTDIHPLPTYKHTNINIQTYTSTHNYRDDRLSMTPKMAQKLVSDFGISRILVGHQPHGDAPTTINYSFPPPPSPSPSSSSDTTAGDTHVSAFASGKNKCVGSTSTDTATDGGRKGGSDSDSNSEGEGGDHFSPPPQRDPFLQITMGDTSYSRNTLWNFNPTYIKKQGKEISLSYDENWQPISLERLVKENATTGGDYVRDSKVDAGRRRTGVAMTLNVCEL